MTLVSLRQVHAIPKSHSLTAEKGVLLHRGYPIEQLVVGADYLDVCYLLLHGDLPSLTERNEL